MKIFGFKFYQEKKGTKKIKICVFMFVPNSIIIPTHVIINNGSILT